MLVLKQTQSSLLERRLHVFVRFACKREFLNCSYCPYMEGNKIKSCSLSETLKKKQILTSWVAWTPDLSLRVWWQRSHDDDDDRLTTRGHCFQSQSVHSKPCHVWAEQHVNVTDKNMYLLFNIQLHASVADVEGNSWEIQCLQLQCN